MATLHKLKRDYKKKFLETPGDRLKYLKLLVRFKCHEVNYILKRVSKKLTLKHFSQLKNLNIPEPTIRKWESGERTLTENGIEKCIKAFRDLGVVASKNWLRDGNGTFPSIKQDPEVDYLKSFDNKTKIFLSYLDKKERFIYVGKGYDSLLNKPIEEIIGKSLSQLLSPKSYAAQKNIIKQVLNGEAKEFEYPWEYEPNKYKMLKISFIPDFDSKNTIVRGMFSFLEETQEPSITNSLSLHDDANTNVSFEQDLYLKVILEIESLLDTVNKG